MVAGQQFHHRVLPVLGLFRSPELLARALPDSWLSMIDAATIEWALAHGDRDSAAHLIRRHMELPLRGAQNWRGRIERFRRGWEQAPERDALPQVIHYATEPLGWLARVHDMPGPATFNDPGTR